MRADDWPTPARIIGELLTSHPEAESLLAEAGHRQALAAWSTADTGTKFTWLRPPGAATKCSAGTGLSRARVAPSLSTWGCWFSRLRAAGWPCSTLSS